MSTISQILQNQTRYKETEALKTKFRMSVEELSIGNELRDSFKNTSKWVNGGINWLGTVEEFYRERATIEKEYASKLKDLCARHFQKKAKLSTSLSVGDEPKITPGSLESASLVLWNELLTQTESIADEKVRFSKELDGTISDKVVQLRSKSSKISRKLEDINTFLVNEKERTEEEVNKAKKHYDSACNSTESARQKVEKSLSDKQQQKLEAKTTDMNIAKNAYLIQISIANRLKDKYYYQDVPELLDYYQELNETRVGILNKLLKNASIIERASNDRIKEKLHIIDQTIDQNDTKLDIAMFIKHNAYDWKEPDDFYFVPSEIWHDDENLVVKEPELTDLKKRLNNCLNEYTTVESQCMDSKQALEEASNDRQKDLSNLTLAFETKIQNALSLLSRFFMADSTRVRLEVEIEVIQNYAGDKDLSYIETREKKKSLLGFLKGKNHNHSVPENNSDAQSVTTIKSASAQKLLNTGIFSLRKFKDHKGGNDSTGSSAQAIALYGYSSTSGDELSISAGETLSVVEADDGSGWTLVSNSDGSQGLVPTSYIQIQAASDTSRTKKKGPSVPPKRGAKKIQYVEALYEYNADGDDELSIRPGDRIILVEDDVDGSGWMDGELDGQRGLFPTSYVRKI